MAAQQLGIGEGKLFPEGRAAAGPMPWVIAIMMFLTVLAAAAGIALASGAARIADEVGNRVTVQVVEPNPEARAAQAAAALAALRATPGVASAEAVSDAEVARLLQPWLGEHLADAELPMPAMIDVNLDGDGRDGLARIRAAVQRAAPSAILSDVADWLGPLTGLLNSLQWLALGLVALMIGATAATVVLAARASLNTHRGTIEILHLMGATDLQIARLFQRRIALDVLFGGLLGFAVAIGVLLLVGGRVAAIGSELLGAAALPSWAWLFLLTLPIASTLLAVLVARFAILRSLKHML